MLEYYHPKRKGGRQLLPAAEAGDLSAEIYKNE